MRLAKRVTRSIRKLGRTPRLYTVRDRIAYQALVVSRRAALLSFVAVLINAVVAFVAITSLALNANSAKNAQAAAAAQAETSTKAVNAAMASAEAAKISASSAQQSTAATLGLERPFLGILRFILNRAGDDDPNPTIDWSFINAGRTPGIVRELNISCKLSPMRLPRTPEYDKAVTSRARFLIDKGGAFGSNAGPNQYEKCKLKQPMTPVELEEYKRGEKALIVFGFIRYEGMLNVIYTKGFAGAAVVGQPNIFDIDNDNYNYELVAPRASALPELSPK